MVVVVVIAVVVVVNVIVVVAKDRSLELANSLYVLHWAAVKGVG